MVWSHGDPWELRLIRISISFIRFWSGTGIIFWQGNILWNFEMTESHLMIETWDRTVFRDNWGGLTNCKTNIDMHSGIVCLLVIWLNFWKIILISFLSLDSILWMHISFYWGGIKIRGEEEEPSYKVSSQSQRHHSVCVPFRHIVHSTYEMLTPIKLEPGSGPQHPFWTVNFDPGLVKIWVNWSWLALGPVDKRSRHQLTLGTT